MTHDEYHADTSRISKSGISRVLKSPAHYWAEYLDPNKGPREETAAMFEGTLLHTTILEPGEVLKRYVVQPADAPSRDCLRHRNAKAPSADTLKNIAWWDHFNETTGGRLLISSAMYDRSQRIADSVRRHPAARWLLDQAGIIEEAHTWEDMDTDAPCKCMPDKRIPDHGIVVDLKSAEDASPDGFGRSAKTYGYPMQGALYLDGLNNYASRGGSYDSFMFIAVEKDPPYAVAVYNIPDDVLQKGRELYLRGLRAYMEARTTGEWPAYSPQVEELQMPSYFFKL